MKGEFQMATRADFVTREQYFQWLEDVHYEGFVLNFNRRPPRHPNRKCHTLHRADCRQIRQDRRYITDEITKAWSDNLGELNERYQQWIGDEPNLCGVCVPPAN
jgi:hypothetical protein